jgi:hypothetical protein
MEDPVVVAVVFHSKQVRRMVEQELQDKDLVVGKHAALHNKVVVEAVEHRKLGIVYWM